MWTFGRRGRRSSPSTRRATASSSTPSFSRASNPSGAARDRHSRALPLGRGGLQAWRRGAARGAQKPRGRRRRRRRRVRTKRTKRTLANGRERTARKRRGPKTRPGDKRGRRPRPSRRAQGRPRGRGGGHGKEKKKAHKTHAAHEAARAQGLKPVKLKGRHGRGSAPMSIKYCTPGEVFPRLCRVRTYSAALYANSSHLQSETAKTKRPLHGSIFAQQNNSNCHRAWSL